MWWGGAKNIHLRSKINFVAVCNRQCQLISTIMIRYFDNFSFSPSSPLSLFYFFLTWVTERRDRDIGGFLAICDFDEVSSSMIFVKKEYGPTVQSLNVWFVELYNHLPTLATVNVTKLFIFHLQLRSISCATFTENDHQIRFQNVKFSSIVIFI